LAELAGRAAREDRQAGRQARGRRGQTWQLRWQGSRQPRRQGEEPGTRAESTGEHRRTGHGDRSKTSMAPKRVPSAVESEAICAADLTHRVPATPDQQRGTSVPSQLGTEVQKAVEN
jgi:hypothetical protein